MLKPAIFILFLVRALDSLPLEQNGTDTSHPRHRRLVANPFALDPTPACYLQFFSGSTPPQDLPFRRSNIRFICQKLPKDSKTYFSTMFDQKAGNAVFSAYAITATQAREIGAFDRTDVSQSWRKESGLKLQGTDQIYAGHGTGPRAIAKGHLNPAHLNSFGLANMRATFTYTNAVPQYAVFNSGQWAVYEKRIATYAQNQCASRSGRAAVMYLLTGTSAFRLQVGAHQPTQDPAKPQLNYFPGDSGAGIVRPNSMWTAGCCVWTNNKGDVEAESLAVMGNNVYDKAKIQMTSMALKELEALLTAAGEPANLFPATPQCRANSIHV